MIIFSLVLSIVALMLAGFLLVNATYGARPMKRLMYGSLAVSLLAIFFAVTTSRSVARLYDRRDDCYDMLVEKMIAAQAQADAALNNECPIPPGADPDLQHEQLQTVREAIQTWLQQQP